MEDAYFNKVSKTTIDKNITWIGNKRLVCQIHIDGRHIYKKQLQNLLKISIKLKIYIINNKICYILLNKNQ